MTDLTTDCFDDMNNSELVNQTNNFDIQTNPWQVEDIGTFSYFCCPECIYRAKTVPDFQVHSIINHPNSKDFFERYGDKYWLEHGDEGENNGDMDSEPIKVINPFRTGLVNANWVFNRELVSTVLKVCLCFHRLLKKHFSFRSQTFSKIFVILSFLSFELFQKFLWACKWTRKWTLGS